MHLEDVYDCYVLVWDTFAAASATVTRVLDTTFTFAFYSQPFMVNYALLSL